MKLKILGVRKVWFYWQSDMSETKCIVMERGPEKRRNWSDLSEFNRRNRNDGSRIRSHDDHSRILCNRILRRTAGPVTSHPAVRQAEPKRKQRSGPRRPTNLKNKDVFVLYYPWCDPLNSEKLTKSLLILAEVVVECRKWSFQLSASCHRPLFIPCKITLSSLFDRSS